MPSLRLRGSDIMLLANHFLHRFSADNGKVFDGFSERATAKIMAYEWPGNVRELENAIERAVVLAEGSFIQPDDLPFEEVYRDAPRIPGSTLVDLERHAILATLNATDGSTKKTAEILGVSVRMIQYRLRHYGSGVTAFLSPRKRGQ
jgi:two-component system, NtrC family, response regulator HydG